MAFQNMRYQLEFVSVIISKLYEIGIGMLLFCNWQLVSVSVSVRFSISKMVLVSVRLKFSKSVRIGIGKKVNWSILKQFLQF